MTLVAESCDVPTIFVPLTLTVGTVASADNGARQRDRLVHLIRRALREDVAKDVMAMGLGHCAVHLQHLYVLGLQTLPH